MLMNELKSTFHIRCIMAMLEALRYTLNKILFQLYVKYGSRSMNHATDTSSLSAHLIHSVHIIGFQHASRRPPEMQELREMTQLVMQSKIALFHDRGNGTITVNIPRSVKRLIYNAPTRTHTYTHIIHTYIHTHIIHTYIHTYNTYIHTHIQYIHTYTHTIHTYIHTYNTYIHTIHTYK
jgi:hypothetical protein